MSQGTNWIEQGSRRRQIRRIDRRMARITARINPPQKLLFDKVRFGSLQMRRAQLMHDYTHRV